MPLDYEDKVDISGDPSPAKPLTNAQVRGVQKTNVDRNRAGPQPTPSETATDKTQAKNGGSPEFRSVVHGNIPDGTKPQAPDGAPSELGTQLGALSQAPGAWQAQADAAIGLNPAHGQDWWKHALEAPVETYFLGKHIYNAFYGAFLDPNAIEASVHDIWHQDNAVGWLMRNAAATSPGVALGQQVTGASQEDVTAGAAGVALPAGADPMNIVYGGATGAKGVALVAKFLLPSAVSAIFGDRHSPSDLAWAIVPAVLFGGKLPAGVSSKLEEAMPGAVKVFEKLSASKLAQEANKAGTQDRQKLLNRVVQFGAMGEMRKPLAQKWESGMEALSKDQEMALGRTLREKYGTLDRDRLIPMMIKDGASLDLIQKTWTKLLRMDYDLTHYADAEQPLVAPNSYLHYFAPDVRKKIDQGFQWTLHMIGQADFRTAGHAADPAVSRFRSLIGLQQTNQLTGTEWKTHLLDVASKEATNPDEQDLLLRSLEGDNAAYLSLSAPMKYVRDSMRLAAAAIGMRAEEEGAITARVANYWPRVGLLIKEAGGYRAMRGAPRLLSSAPIRHRALGVTSVDMLTETRMQVEQLYKTVAEANAAVDRHRTAITDAIVQGTPWHEIESAPETDAKVIEQIQAIASTDPALARAEAQRYAEGLIPQFSTNPFDGIDKLTRDLHSITSRIAVNDLLQNVGKDGRAMAVLRPTDDRAIAGLRAQGYRPINVPGFSHVLVNDQYGKLLEQATRKPGEGLPGWLKRAAEVEHSAVAMIMYSPRIHGMNMAARLGTAFVMHPLEISRWFGEGLLNEGGASQFGWKGLLPKGETKIGPEEYRMIPRRYGIVPPNPNTPNIGGGFAEGYLNKIGDLMGDTDMSRVPLVRDMAGSDAVAKASSGAKAILGNVKDLAWGRQSDLWSWVSDFGNMMWWIEYASARRGGMVAGGLEHEQAARYATARANSWMGHVSPVDTNPNLQAALKTVTFAPNWWRTWGELLTGYYRNQGFGWSAETIKYVVENEIKTAAAAVLFQQLTANVMNMVLGGHTIYQNDPGNWGKVEITAPWATGILNEMFKLGLDPKTGRDAKGAKLTMENPLARQMTDTEQLMGLLTTSPNWSPETMFQGARQFGSARLSPVADALASLGNIDLYRSVSSGGLRYIDPTHDTFMGNPGADALAGILDLTPFASIGQQMQQAIIQDQGAGDITGPFGLQIPKVIADSLGPSAIGNDLIKSLLVGMTGVNPPYMRSSKTPGVSPTDDQYKAVHEIQDTYQQQMNSLSTATLGGQMAPYQWLATYRQLSAKHAAEMQAIFKHAPEYNNGPLGLTNSWEGLYDQATDKSGVLDSDKLRALQAQWRQTHSQADYAAVQNELHANDTKYPMLALYHKTQDAYYNWQSDWCKENNIDLATLQSDMSGWSKVYSDRNASRQWLAAHPEIAQFEAAKRSEFESGNSHYGMAGLMYALFFNPTMADRYLLASGETPQQLEQQVQAEQVPPAA